MNTLAGALSGVLITAGALLALAILTGRLPERPPARARRRQSAISRWLNVPNPTLRRRRRITLGAALATGPIAWALSGIPVTVVIAPGAVLGLPWLFRSSGGRDYIAHIDAIDQWTRLVQGLLTANRSIEQAITASARSAPEPIAVPVTLLARRLENSWATRDALLAFADDLDDQLGDMVVLSLIASVQRRGPGAAQTLEGLADTIGARVRSRRDIETEQDKPRRAARQVTLLVSALLLYVVLLSPFSSTYRTPVGQVILVIGSAAYVGVLLLLKRLSRVQRPTRILGEASALSGRLVITRASSTAPTTPGSNGTRRGTARTGGATTTPRTAPAAVTR